MISTVGLNTLYQTGKGQLHDACWSGYQQIWQDAGSEECYHPFSVNILQLEDWDHLKMHATEYGENITCASASLSARECKGILKMTA